MVIVRLNIAVHEKLFETRLKKVGCGHAASVIVHADCSTCSNSAKPGTEPITLLELMLLCHGAIPVWIY